MSQIVDLDVWRRAAPTNRADDMLVEHLMAGDVDDGPFGCQVSGDVLPPDRPHRSQVRRSRRHARLERF